MIGVFGSAFNPPTLGHKDALIQAAKHCKKILLVPSASHAFGKKMLPYEQRYRMLLAFAHDVQEEINCTLEVSDIEQHMQLEGFSPIYTFDVLSRIQARNPEEPLAFIMGPDNASPSTWQKFYKSDEIDARWSKLICQEQKTIRSTQVREAINSKENDAFLLNLITPSVLQIIRENQLYQAEG